MRRNIFRDSINCLSKAQLEDTTYEIARDITLDYIKELEEENERLKEDRKLDKFSLLDVKTPERLKKKLNELVDYINKEK